MQRRVHASWMLLGAMLIGAAVADCSSTNAPPVDLVVVHPSPQVIYVTPTPQATPTPEIIYVTPTPGAAASPVQSTPTPAPTPTLGASATTLSFGGLGGGFAQQLTISEAAFTGSFVESDTCSSIATVVAAGAVVGPSATYVVTPVGAGTCAARFSGSPGQQLSVAIVVNLTGIILQ